MSELTKNTIVHKTNNLNEVQTILKNISSVVPVAGATSFFINEQDEILDLPKHILDLNFVNELKIISRTDRYFEFGSLATINQILELGRINIPEVLYDSIEKLGNYALRSLATIGGNIAKSNPRSSCFLPLLALDAKIEIKTATETQWIPFSRYIDESFYEERNKKFIITKIRIPNEAWTISFYKRLGDENYISNNSGSFLFLARLQKNILSDMSLLFASDVLIREKEFDNLLLGKSLPLPEREVSIILNQAKEIFTRERFNCDYHYFCFFNLLEDNLYNLS